MMRQSFYARFRMMDTHELCSKLLRFGVLFSVIYTISLFLNGNIQRWIPSSLHSYGAIGSLLLAMLLYDPLNQYISKLFRRLSSGKNRVDYTDLIVTLTHHNLGPRDLKSLSLETVHFLQKHLEIEWITFYARKGFSDDLFQSASSGTSALPKRTNEKDLLAWFEHYPEPFYRNGLMPEPPFSSALTKLNVPDKAEVVFPIFVDRKVVGILCLGKKTSKRGYSPEEKILLNAVIDRISMLLFSGKLLKEIATSYLELAQRMKMAALRKLSQGIHHEIRNPLHTISLYASATQNQVKLYRDNNKKKRSLNSLIERSATMLSEIKRIQNTLTRFSQFAQPHHLNEMLGLNLSEEVDEFILLMKEAQKLDRIKLTIDIPRDLSIQTNHGVFQEILFNLFNNAFEAMQGDGKIELTAFRAGPEAICFTFKDSGPGIDDSAREFIFDEYFTTKNYSDAIGIGLSITKHRIESMGGSIEAENDGGAKFTLTMKAA